MASKKNIFYEKLIVDAEKLIESGSDGICESKICYFCKVDELFDILEKAHTSVRNKRTIVMKAEMEKKYCNVTRQTINLYLSLCEQCQLKKKTKYGLAVRPILSDSMNSRNQVDLIDMQSEPDEDYRFIMNYQDHLTKFTTLCPLITKTAEK
ncbi:KRAB-A domain-containing protein 2-like, partial [Centruroides vittatus]|uniref:KRAB-A domain-containing protein 2-like n=1 Tax=Centruroides vittatus TaxID=120091 RepID=UPI0035100E0F